MSVSPTWAKGTEKGDGFITLDRTVVITTAMADHLMALVEWDIQKIKKIQMNIKGQQTITKADAAAKKD